jgi:putative transposase
MRKSKFTSEQIAYCLTQAEAGVPIGELCRKYGISTNTFYRWKSKFGAMAPSEVRRMKELEEENTRLKKLVADLSLDRQILQDALRKKA